MNPPSAVWPKQLFTVSVLFVLYGFWALTGMIVQWMRGDIFLDFGVLGLFIGPGLLAYRSSWRTWALALLWLSMLLPLILMFDVARNGESQEFHAFWVPAGHVPQSTAIALLAGQFAVAAWSYRVLVRPNIRVLFRLLCPPASESDASD
jgi:hypothetical protein